ncbi:acid-sensing ion channel 1-like [Portunus trituberculatus]|nr:acid-sensing ion channel 1-like [Portunus trituberculatus]
MTGSVKGRAKKTVEWQPAGDETCDPQQEDSPPAYYTMYPETPRPTKDTLTSMDHQHTTQEKCETKGSTSKDKQTSDGGKKVEQKTLVKISKETKEKLLEKAHGARATLSDFCRKTTAHGFNHVVEEDVPLLLRVFWLVVTLSSLGALLSVAYSVTRESFVTKRPYTEVTYRDSRKSGLPFPAFTVCSLSRFWKSKMNEYNVSKSMASYILLAVGGPEVVSSTLKTDTRMIRVFQDELTNFLEERNLTLSQIITLLSPTCEDVVAGCYNDVESLPGKLCCERMFRPSITTLGQCFSTLGVTGNTSTYMQTTAGLIGGTRIIFTINKDEYMEYDPNVVSTTSLNEVGIHVSLSYFDVKPTVASNMHAVRIAPDTSANIALSITRIDHQERYIRDWPWSSQYADCVMEHEYKNLTEERQMNTENNFYFALMYRHCLLLHANCSAIPMRLTDDQTAECMPDQVIHHLFFENEVKACVLKNLYQYENASNRLCYTTSLTRQLSYTDLKKDSLQEYRQSPKYVDRSSLAMAVVYYSELGYTEYYERIPTFSTWFSDLGGQMGLFMGASFITIVELFFTACYVVRVVVCRAARVIHAKLSSSKNSTG